MNTHINNTSKAAKAYPNTGEFDRNNDFGNDFPIRRPFSSPA